jgi:hypothetical protein
MPAGFLVAPILNQFFADLDSDARVMAGDALNEVSSVRDAVERLSLLEELEEDMAAEARAVFAALPPEVDRQILDAVRDGLDRRVPLTFEWQENTDIRAEIVPADGTGGVHIILRTPPGREFN